MRNSELFQQLRLAACLKAESCESSAYSTMVNNGDVGRESNASGTTALTHSCIDLSEVRHLNSVGEKFVRRYVTVTSNRTSLALQLGATGVAESLQL